MGVVLFLNIASRCFKMNVLKFVSGSKNELLDLKSFTVKLDHNGYLNSFCAL